MSNHKDGSPGVHGCDRFDSGAACPECNRYEATTCIDLACMHVKRLEPFSSGADALEKEIKSLWNRVDALTWDKLKRETEAKP
jgi:hypothetical protein